MGTVSQSQNSLILEYLKAGHSLTQWEAYEIFQCTRLSGRIFDLKALGHDIKEVSERHNGKTFSRYYLPDSSNGKTPMKPSGGLGNEDAMPHPAPFFDFSSTEFLNRP